MAHFTVIVNQSPFDHQGSYSALRFSRAVAHSQHSLAAVFFYQSGVNNGNAFQAGHSDELNMLKEWRELHSQCEVPLLVCITASNRRGVISAEDAADADQSEYNLAQPFIASGLGELCEAMLTSDRVVQF